MTENVKIYTPGELTEMGWDFKTTQSLKIPPYDQEFEEPLFAEDTPADWKDNVSLYQFKPYFQGPKAVPSLKYNKFTGITYLCDVERMPDIPDKWAINLKAGMLSITGLTTSEIVSLNLEFACYTNSDTPLPFTVGSQLGSGGLYPTYNGFATKYTRHESLEIRTAPIYLPYPPGKPFSVYFQKDNVFTDGGLHIVYFRLIPARIPSITTSAGKSFTDPKTGAVRTYSNTPVSCSSAEASLQSASEYASCIEYGEQVIVAAEPGKMYFPEVELYQWISPQQLDQFKKMYPDCVEISYNSALGYVYSQIGELYDIASILAGDTNDGTSKIMRWILTVLTAYNITSPSARHSETLRDNYEMVVKKVTEMKNGATTLHDAPIKETPNAWGTVVNGSKNKMRG